MNDTKAAHAHANKMRTSRMILFMELFDYFNKNPTFFDASPTRFFIVKDMSLGFEEQQAN
jgi:hypothetical protein